VNSVAGTSSGETGRQSVEAVAEDADAEDALRPGLSVVAVPMIARDR
jgi:hypothetical protein